MDLEYEYSIIPVIYAFGFKHLTSKFRSGDKHLTHFLMKIVLKHLRLIYIYSWDSKRTVYMGERERERESTCTLRYINRTIVFMKFLIVEKIFSPKQKIIYSQ